MPSTLVVGARHDTLTEVVSAAVTEIENAGRLVVAVPSFTLITMPDAVPTLFEAGVPLSEPLALSNVAHDGLPWMLNVSGSPSRSAAVGLNAYGWPVGRGRYSASLRSSALRFACVTLMANAGRLAEAVPSLTLITMLAEVPTSVAAGAP